MSITNRIRLVRTVANAIALAVAVIVVWNSASALPQMLLLARAAGAIGLLVTLLSLVVLALSLAATEREDLEPEATQPLQPQTSYQLPPA